MKREKRESVVLLAAMLLALTFAASAQMPVVNDQAGVLSNGLIDEAAQLSSMLRQYTGVELVVITRHFLGGEDVQAYVNKLQLDSGGEGRIVFAIIVGEERYALSLGAKARELISKESADNLLSRHFREPFLKERAYDNALANFLLALSDQLQLAAGATLPKNQLLRAYANQESLIQPSATRQHGGNTPWLDSIFSDPDKAAEGVRQYDEDAHKAAKGKEEGLSLFQIALIGFVLYKVFGKKKPGKRGCGPLGWIFGTWGVSKFFGWRK